MKRLLLALLSIFILGCQNRNTGEIQGPTVKTDEISAEDKILQSAYQNQQADLQVQGRGIVNKILPDDTSGSKHQRFILELASGQTLLIAHNIDIAPKIKSLAIGDTVEFFGEYEWNDQGGVIHWTHSDPNGNHINGWLIHNGITYK